MLDSIMLDNIFRNPYGGPLVAAALCFLLLGVRCAADAAITYARRRLDYLRVRREWER